MATARELLSLLQTQYPEYWAWLQDKANALEKVQALAKNYASPDGKGGAFLKAVQELKSFQTWTTTGGGTEEEEVPPEEETIEDEPFTAATPAPYEIPQDVRGALMQFLTDYELPQSLMTFIESALQQKMSYAEIVLRLRETPEYKAVYPENDMRKQFGLSWWSEDQIREYRNRARSILKTYLGIAPTSVSNLEIANLIAQGVDLGEWERRIQTHAAFLQWGPVVKNALSQELGFEVPDERVWAFMNKDIPTPELDLAYRRALMRGQPAVLGLGMRPSDEADILIKAGFSPEQAFAGYQGIAEELPRAERMRMIEAYLGTQTDKLPVNPLEGASQSLLFRALMLKDAGAYSILSQTYARELARWQAGGGPAGGGAGLLAPENR